MTDKKKLGSGLSALFGSFEEGVADAEQITSYNADGTLNEGVSEIELSIIDANPNQPRKTFDEVGLKELALSIRKHGVIQPIIVCENSERYTVIAGERRLRAAKLAGLTAIPALVRSFSPREQKEIALIENLQREDLNPIEEARAMQSLLDEYGSTQEELAIALGKSRPDVTNSLRLLSLCTDVQDMILAGRLSKGHGRALASLKYADVQLAYARAACDKKMSVHALELLVNACINPAKKRDPSQKLPMAKELKELVLDMQRLFKTTVKAVGTPEKGRIYIDYYTADDLERIFDLLDNLKKD